MEDGVPTFRPILSAKGTPTYKLAKFCDKLLKPITTNEYTIRDSFSFAKEVEEFDPNIIIASFDIKSLFTNLPLTESIGLCVENLYGNHTHIDSLSKSSFRKFLEMTMQACRNRGGLGELQPPQIFAKVGLLPIDNNSEKKKGAKKHKPCQIPQKLLVTFLLSM